MGGRSTGRKALSLALAAAMLAAVPARLAVDAAAPDGRAQVETTHDPSRCGYLHDHAACQQLFASAAATPPDAAAERSPPAAPERAGPRRSERPLRHVTSPALPRAPPHPGS